MLDRSRTYGRSPRDLRPALSDASTAHYWLMRRDLSLSDWRAWPLSLRQVAFGTDNASAVHRLLVLGSQHGGGGVAEFNTWRNAFQTDPEFDARLCFVVEDALGVVAVAVCWTSAFIRHLVVDPRVRRRGVGLALLNQVFQAFAQRREGYVDLNVMESNVAARRLYECAGMHYVQRFELDPHLVL